MHRKLGRGSLLRVRPSLMISARQKDGRQTYRPGSGHRANLATYDKINRVPTSSNRAGVRVVPWPVII